MSRGPDFAHELTDSERRTLDMLLRQVTLAPTIQDAAVRHVPGLAVDPGIERRTRRPGWRGWLAVTVSAATVAAIALGTGLLPVRPGAAPVVAAAPTQTSTVDMLRALAAAARRSGPPTRAVETTIVALAVHKGAVCAENTYEVAAAMKPVAGWAPVSLIIARVAPPAGVSSWLDCPETVMPSPTPYEKVFAGTTTGDGTAGWTELLARVKLQALLPDLIDPRAIPDGLTVGTLSADPSTLAAALDKVGTLPPGGSAAWWTAVAQLLSSPRCPPAVRSTALALAANRSAEVRVVTDHPTDILGRPGVTVRVPYTVDGFATHADLTFDEATGALLQRAVYGGSGQFWSVTITARR
jgi:hypothetical protein